MTKKTQAPPPVVSDGEAGIALQGLLALPSVQRLLLADPRFQIAAQAPAAPVSVGKGKKAKSTVPEQGREMLPPNDGAPRPTFPIAVAQQRDNVQLAPPPLADRYPTILGQQLTYQYISSVARLCISGYRQQAVDLWRELLEQDPHLGSVVQKRVLQVANGRIEVRPADIDEDDDDFELANAAAKMVRKEIGRIPGLVQQLVTLLWGIYYGVASAEIIWNVDAKGWHVERLEFIHSRRIAWPDQQSWDAYVWDQGQVFGWNSPWGSTPTNAGVFGLRLADWPGKFIFFAPQLFADYPTRDGLARQCAMWALMKRVGVRGAVDYLERFAKGWLDISFTTQAGGEPRAATEEDIQFAYHLADVLGPADGRTAVHADTIKIDPKSFESGGGRSSKITWSEWISICNSEISKLVLGGTLTTEVGGASGGNRALGEVQERAEVDLEQFDATALAETLKRDLVTWLVRLNMPEALHVVPNIIIDIETEPDAKSIVDNAEKLVNMGAPLEAEDVASKAGYKCVPSEEKDANGRPKPRRLFKSDFINPSLVDPSLMSAEAKQAAQDKIDLETTTALTKAATPTAPVGRPSASATAKTAAKTPKPATKAAKPKAKVTPKPKPANDAAEAEEDDDDEEDAAQ